MIPRREREGATAAVNEPSGAGRGSYKRSSERPASEGCSAVIRGVARVVGDNVNTDYIISSRRKRDARDASSLVEFIFEHLPRAPEAARDRSGPAGLGTPAETSGRIQPGDIIIAGRNFGCGSAMEIACEVLKAAGVAAVLAVSFSRTFFRNAVNIGLPIIEAETQGICDGDLVLILAGDDGDAASGLPQPRAGHAVFACPARGIVREIRLCGGFAQELKSTGGLLAYIRARGSIPRGILRD